MSPEEAMNELGGTFPEVVKAIQHNAPDAEKRGVCALVELLVMGRLWDEEKAEYIAKMVIPAAIAFYERCDW